MATVSFDVSDDLARKIRGLVESGRASDITFCFRGRVIVEVLAMDRWRNETPPRSYDPRELTGGRKAT